MKTVDPLPLREDCDANMLRFAEGSLPVLKNLDRQTNTPGQPSSCTLPYCHPSSRIQGRLRDPEFQHNSKYFGFNFLPFKNKSVILIDPCYKKNGVPVSSIR